MLLVLRTTRSVGHIRSHNAAGASILDCRNSVVDDIVDRHTNDDASKEWMVYALHDFDFGIMGIDRHKSTNLASCTLCLFRGKCHCATSAARHTCRHSLLIVNMKVRVADDEDSNAAYSKTVRNVTRGNWRNA